MNPLFTANGWLDYQHWVDNERKILERLNGLIEDARRSPFHGLGKPEPLKGDLAGWWSRRIAGDHRLVYRVTRTRGDQRLEVSACRFHHRRGPNEGDRGGPAAVRPPPPPATPPRCAAPFPPR